MKNVLFKSVKLLFLLVIVAPAFISCERQTDDVKTSGKLEFSFIADELQAITKSASVDTMEGNSYNLLISVMNEDSVLVLDKELIPLYKFANQFVSTRIELDEGQYFLSEFMVVNSTGDVIYATPKRGSKLAYLVSKTLPLHFKIAGGVTNKLQVEVLPVNNQAPADFGYISFGVDIVKPLSFYVAVFQNRPVLMMAPTFFEPAKLTIYGPDNWEYNFKTEKVATKLVVREKRGIYTFVVTLESGYVQTFLIPLKELKNTTASNPLMLGLDTDGEMHEMIIKTSPDNTQDALIVDIEPSENYGWHKLFVGSFVSEPVLTVMRTTRSLMFVDVRRQLPKSATLKKVELVLNTVGGIYPMEWDSSRSDIPPPMYQGVLKQIVEPWNEDSVTWSNQPKTVDANMVIIDYEPWINSIQRSYDITKLFIPEQEIAVRNHGFMLSQYPEDIPGGIEFASSDYEMESVRPYFKVYYTLPN